MTTNPSQKNPRDHGYGEFPKVTGAPRVKKLVTEPGMHCPNCGCATLADIEADVVNERLRGGHGTGKYLGCPACPWAGPMVTVAAGEPKGEA
jgi:hypothetical protein